MIDYKVAIPSYGRCGIVKTIFNFYPERVNLFVAEKEYKIYKNEYPDFKVITYPDELIGNTAKIRNYIRDTLTDVRYLVMADDDIPRFGYFEKRDYHYFDVESFDLVIRNAFLMAEEIGTVLWGLNVQSDPKFYREYAPFSLLSPILGPFSGQILDDHSRKVIRYDERIPLKEDYDLFLQVVLHYRKVLRFNKYFYMAGHINNKGGLTSFRRKEEEERQAKILQKKWGKKIVKIDRKTINPRLHIPLRY